MPASLSNIVSSPSKDVEMIEKVSGSLCQCKISASEGRYGWYVEASRWAIMVRKISCCSVLMIEQAARRVKIFGQRYKGGVNAEMERELLAISGWVLGKDTKMIVVGAGLRPAQIPIFRKRSTCMPPTAEAG
jgi:hypothetical protein